MYFFTKSVEEIQCIASWKEGSNKYFVGKSDHQLATSDEDRSVQILFIINT